MRRPRNRITALGKPPYSPAPLSLYNLKGDNTQRHKKKHPLPQQVGSVSCKGHIQFLSACSIPSEVLYFTNLTNKLKATLRLNSSQYCNPTQRPCCLGSTLPLTDALDHFQESFDVSASREPPPLVMKQPCFTLPCSCVPFN